MTDGKLPTTPVEDDRHASKTDAGVLPHIDSVNEGTQTDAKALVQQQIFAREGAEQEHFVQAIARSVRSEVRREMHSGPMPSPAYFAQYDKVLPGTALSIRNEFEANSQHIRAMETTALNGQIENDAANRKVAQHLVWGAFGLIALLGVTGHENVAIAVAVTTVTAVIGGFLRTYISKKPESSDESSS
jgi:uncharacterized membrane protein